jgi:hypothetical protein
MLDLLRQGQRAQEIGEIVGQPVKLEPHGGVAESTAGDAIAIADDQRPDQQLRVDGRPYRCAVEWRQVRPRIA